MRSIWIYSCIVSSIFGISPAKQAPGKQENSCYFPIIEQGDLPLTEQAPGGYNRSAVYATRDQNGLFFKGTYLLWHASEDGLDIATSASFNRDQITLQFGKNTGQALLQPFDYTSGFKVAAGYVSAGDQMVVKAEYTQLCDSISQSQAAKNPGNGQGVWASTNWFLQTGTSGQSLAATSFPSFWEYTMRWLDLQFERPFYSGKSLTFNPHVGLRASWLDQEFNVHAQNVLNTSSPGGDIHSRNKSQSWGLGPRGGVGGNWLLGSGWKIKGGVGASLIYTRYMFIKHKEDSFITGGDPISFRYNQYGAVRPMVEANLGLGWGSYIGSNRYHLDLSATYDWNYLWAQNMMRFANDQWAFGSGSQAGDFALHGLTLNAALQF